MQTIPKAQKITKALCTDIGAIVLFAFPSFFCFFAGVMNVLQNVTDSR
jgi:hypothetical protein